MKKIIKRPVRQALCSVILLFGFAAAMSASSFAAPMSVAGQLTVGSSGAATYAIPIQTPPGTGGIEPKLSLSYNSQTGNGLLGVGWSLDGLSAITRCAQTIAQDGVRGGINFDANDRYCLDGQRLLAVNGTYGADGTEYRTEQDSFSRIVSYSAAGAGPAWFKVWTKSGQIIEYGNSTDSRVLAIKVAGSSAPWPNGSARLWAMDKISDTKGNYLTYTYTQDQTSGDYYPQRIDYTGNVNAGQSPNNSVQFVYETRSDITPVYFSGAFTNNLVRLKTVQVYQGTILNKEYRTSYQTGASTGRSRLAGITECALPANLCKPAVNFTLSELSSPNLKASSSTSFLTSFLADVNGDGRADFIAQQSDGLYVSLANGSGAGAPVKWINGFGYGQGYSDMTLTPILLIDVNGDGLADVVAFASDGVYVALSNGSSFGTPTKWIADFGSATAFAWTNMGTYPRTLADVNGDGLPDIVGFRNDGVYVALNTGHGFAPAVKWIGDFGTTTPTAYASSSVTPRFVMDVNGDGLADIVAFAPDGVHVALSNGSSFAPSTKWSSDFGSASTFAWTNMDTYPRTFGDINGDGLPDIVGFRDDGVYVALNNGSGFNAASKWISDFGTATPVPYATNSAAPRFVADMNGDGKADIVGFSATGVQVALNVGSSFSPSTQWIAGFGSNAGYSAATPRQLADVDGDGFPDIVGTLNGTNVALSGATLPPDVMTSASNGLGLTATLSYNALTTPGIYTRGSGAVYPQTDLTLPLYVVSFVRNPNGLGSGYTLDYYQYGSLKADLTGRGLLGFGWLQTLQDDSNTTVRTTYRQDWPYIGLPSDVQRTQPGSGNSGLLSLTTNSYGCINPQTVAACTVAPGNRYFPYLSQSIQAGWDVNGAALPVVTTTNQFDSYGNATQIGVNSSDGYLKTTTNTYVNDTTNWFLGRLTRSQVQSTSTGTPINNAPNGVFVFNQTISSNTTDYNLKAAAITAGWDQVAPLNATVTINSGVIVGSSSATSPAFDTGSGFTAGTTLSLINNGTIAGKGGAGGVLNNIQTAPDTGNPGSSGGVAFSAQFTISVTNKGTIGGGGGGGGGGAGYPIYFNDNGSVSGVPGAAGGAGAGYTSTGGSTVATGVAGDAGGWYSDSSYPYGISGGSGGTGGSLGANGSNGTNAKNNAPCDSCDNTGIAGGTGGSAGAAVIGNASIIWIATGTRLGSLLASRQTPTVSAITPNVGPIVGGTFVTLTGTGFIPGATVTIGGIAAAGCTVNSATTMVCLTPAGNSAGVKDVVLSLPGSSVTLTGGYTYQNLSAVSISPNFGSFAGGDVVHITGSGFAPGVTVTIGGAIAANCAINGPTAMTCVTTANSAGLKDVVVNFDGKNTTLSGAFTYQNLTVTAIAPNSGTTQGGTPVVLTGTGFSSATQVTVGGVLATGCTVNSATTMQCITPANSPGVRDVGVNLGGANVTLAGGFTYKNMFVFNPVIGSNTTNYNLKAAAIAAGWDQVAPLSATVTINSGVYVYASTTSGSGFDTGITFPAGTVLTLINNGYITGAGGNGGNGGAGTGAPIGGGAGGAGGAALRAQTALIISNNGTIAGGGGGGGGGASTKIVVGRSYKYCGGGGGGGGVPFGAGGAGGGSSSTCVSGAGGGAASLTGGGGGGGGGANYGNPGSSGAAIGGTGGGAGGAPGAAVTGNANVTWTVSGTRLGVMQ